LRLKPCRLRDFQIYPDGSVTRCCPTWNSTRVGNITEQSLFGLMSAPKTVELQKSFLNGCFSGCDRFHCPELSEYLKWGRSGGSSIVPVEPATLEKLGSPVGDAVNVFFCYDRSCE
jgi:hypothetical protein